MSRWIVAPLALALMTGCLGRIDNTAEVEGVAAPTSGGEGCETNSYGVCYPTEDIGTRARDGKIWGNRIPNLRFVGFRATDAHHVTDTTTSGIISLADYYDPLGTTGNVMLVINSNHEWCGPSNQQAEMWATTWAEELAPLGVIALEALDDGPVVYQSATLDDLRKYMANHQSNYSGVVDPMRSLSVYFTDMAWDPDVLVIDLRSMEILSATVGFNYNADQELGNLARSISASPPRP
jgi:hypothetical protein